MPVVRLCICPCGRVSVQEVTEDALCYKCGTYYQTSIDWFNLDADELKPDLQNALETLGNIQDKQAPPEN